MDNINMLNNKMKLHNNKFNSNNKKLNNAKLLDVKNLSRINPTNLT